MNWSGHVLRSFDPWRSNLCTCPEKLSLNPYTGCSHKCLYCYATSYIGLRESTAKDRLLVKLRRDLRRAPRNLVINMSTSSDPYPPVESNLRLTRSVLKMLIEKDFPILITTKSALVTRDIDLLSKGRVAVTMTITSLDEKLCRVIEPGASNPSDRIRAVKTLIDAGIPVGVRIDPIIPYLKDDENGLLKLLEKLAELGVKFVVTSTYKARPDNLKRLLNAFPELEGKLKKLYLDSGVYISGYYYLNSKLRREILLKVTRIARKLDMQYATCREGFKNVGELYNAPTCDGSHLIK